MVEIGRRGGQAREKKEYMIGGSEGACFPAQRVRVTPVRSKTGRGAP